MRTTNRFHQYGSPEILNVESDQVGAPVPGRARLRHKAIGVNFIDTMFRQGIFRGNLIHDPIDQAMVRCA